MRCLRFLLHLPFFKKLPVQPRILQREPDVDGHIAKELAVILSKGLRTIQQFQRPHGVSRTIEDRHTEDVLRTIVERCVDG